MTAQRGTSGRTGTTSATTRAPSTTAGSASRTANATATATDRIPATGREALLARAVAFTAEHGFRDVSLRELAAALGTSHRMLIYHFGSKEELYVEVIRAFEAGQRQAVTELVASSTGTPQQILRAVWRQLSVPENEARIRLYFEVYGQALRGGPDTAELLERLVTDWLAPMEDLERARGTRPALARANVRLSVAVLRGLLLDLVASGDRRGVDAAFERFVSGFDPGDPPPRRRR